MNGSTPDKDRRLLPRWRTLFESENHGELQFSKKIKSQDTLTEFRNQLEILIAEWRKEQSIENAAELVSTGIVVGVKDEVKEAAKSLIGVSSQVSPTLIRVSNLLLGNVLEHEDLSDEDFSHLQSVEQVYRQISRLKIRVRAAPRDAISWIELARLYTVLGQVNSASKCVQVAIILAPNNRFVLRSASRFFVHTNEVGRGLYIIRKSNAIDEDPWLQAAEISLADIVGAPSRYLKKGINSILNKTWEPRHTAELCGAAATTLNTNGDRRARKFMRLSMQDPNENALAQAEWAAFSGWAPEVPPEVYEELPAPEALTFRKRQERLWEEAIQACLDWRAMEPTSSRPLDCGAFISLVALEDGDKGLFFMEKIKMLKPDDQMIRNNMAVAFAYKGDVEKASKLGSTLNLSRAAEHKQPTYIATTGLIEYRKGSIKKGRILYLDAAQRADMLNDTELKALVLWHMLREESKFGTPRLEEIVEYMKKKYANIRTIYPEIVALEDKIYVDLKKSRRNKLMLDNTPLQEMTGFNKIM